VAKTPSNPESSCMVSPFSDDLFITVPFPNITKNNETAKTSFYIARNLHFLLVNVNDILGFGIFEILLSDTSLINFKKFIKM